MYPRNTPEVLRTPKHPPQGPLECAFYLFNENLLVLAHQLLRSCSERKNGPGAHCVKCIVTLHSPHSRRLFAQTDSKGLNTKEKTKCEKYTEVDLNSGYAQGPGMD